jgi:hypothetical protein
MSRSETFFVRRALDIPQSRPAAHDEQPPKAGAAGPPLQGLPPSHTRPPRSAAGNISSDGCLKTGPQYTPELTPITA